MSTPLDVEPRFASIGKEVLRCDGSHYADACDVHAAEMIAAALCRQAREIDAITDKLMPFEVIS